MKTRQLSIRLTLTLWYSVMLAVIISVFATVSYAYLSREFRRSFDASLEESAEASVQAIRRATRGRSGADAEQRAAEAVGELRFRERRISLFEPNRGMIATSEAASEEDDSVRSLPLSALLVGSPGSRFASFGNPGREARAYVVTMQVGGRDLLIIVSRPLEKQNETLTQIRRAFYLAFPLALALSAIIGYLLAMRSLLPIARMSRQAAEIDANHLSSRIDAPQNGDELAQLAGVLNHLLSRLEASFIQQRSFMADASHELRTPIAIIRGEAEIALLRDDRPAGEYQESLDIVLDEAERLTGIVENLLMLARADSGNYPLRRNLFDLDELVRDTFRGLRSLAAEKQISMTLRCDAEAVVVGDEILIRQLLLNLLGNSLKHIPRGGTVIVTILVGDDSCLLEVEDSGTGIPLESQPHVFDRFYRADKSRPRGEAVGGSGAGLGLSIAQWIAALHGGKVELVSSGPDGTTFRLTLPWTSGSADGEITPEA